MDQMLATISSGMLIRQVLTIVLLGIIGYLFIWMTGSRLEKGMRVLLSFPVGLSFFCTGIYSMLVIKIRINIPRLIFVLLFAFVTVCIISFFYRKITGRGEKPDLKNFDLRLFLIFIILCTAVAAFCCAGILSVSLDNDSYYYYSTYPQILIEEGDLKYEFDVLLTDSGIMTAIINSLPYIFGFLNTFGIQHFLNVNFLMIFATALYFELSENTTAAGTGDSGNLMGNIIKNKGPALVSFAVTVFLLTSPAYITTAKFVMAGDYFMVFFFILMYFGFREAGTGQDMPFVLMLLTVVTGMLRQEGPIMAAFLIFCLSVLEYENRKLAYVYVLPLITAALLYYLRIFIFLKVKPLYAFLTPMKAVIIIAGLGALLVYVLLIRGRSEKLRNLLPYLILLFLIVLNIAMLIKNHSRYLHNIYAFFMNIRQRNGWGYFGYFFFIFLLLAVFFAIKKKNLSISFFDMLMIGYILTAVCAAWGRGDELRVGTGDSGNRVMLTAVPIITFAMTLRLYSNLKTDRKQNS